MKVVTNAINTNIDNSVGEMILRFRHAGE